jgi:hypothetical protein
MEKLKHITRTYLPTKTLKTQKASELFAQPAKAKIKLKH